MSYERNQEAWDALRSEREELVERLRVAEQQRDELAAQIEVTRDALNYLAEIPQNKFVWKGSPESNTGVRRAIAEYMPTVASALALGDLHSDILRQRDARTLREAAEKLCRSGYDDTSYSGLVGLADELERKNG